MKPRQDHKPEFKEQVAKEYLSGKRPSQEIADEHGLWRQQVTRWAREYRLNKDEAFRGKGKKGPEARLRAMERELELLKEENALLKKARALWDQHQKSRKGRGR